MHHGQRKGGSQKAEKNENRGFINLAETEGYAICIIGPGVDASDALTRAQTPIMFDNVSVFRVDSSR